MTSRSDADDATDGPTDGTGARLLRHAQTVADTGDRWFLSLAQGLGQIGAWARREKDFVAESAVAAAATTAEVVKPMVGRFRPARRAAPTTDPGPDLPEDPAVPETPPAPEELEAPRNPPGVLPVLEVLGKVVADHEPSQYSSLQTDHRFWALVRLLQSLTHDGAEALVKPHDPPSPRQQDHVATETGSPGRARVKPGLRPGLQLLRARTE